MPRDIEKKRARNREWQERNREKVRAYNRVNSRKYYNNNTEKCLMATKKRNKEHGYFYSIKTKYGVIEEQYWLMFYEQNGVCKICRNSCSTKLCVDHNHETMEIRGLLCKPCNTGLGYFKDNINTLEAAIKYLQNKQGEFYG